ncbi:MAG: putative chromosome-partitioning protein ParB, partial [Alphaproteobacteria bacterium MarineAlpha8_Bin1]
MKKNKSNTIKNKIKSRSATLIKTKKNQNKITKKSEPKQKKRLGMGLSSLLSKDEELASVIKSKVKVSQFPKNESRTTDLHNVTNFEDKIGKINEKISSQTSQKSLPIQFLVSGKFQPRKSFDQQELEELAESIRTNGVLQPILVRPLNNSGTSYEIIAGERRWRASQIAKLHEVPVIIRSFNDETAL